MIEMHMAMNRKAGTDAESLTRPPAITAITIIDIGLKAASDSIEYVARHCETSEEERKSQQPSWLEYGLIGVVSHRHLLSLNIPTLKGFVNG